MDESPSLSCQKIGMLCRLHFRFNFKGQRLGLEVATKGGLRYICCVNSWFYELLKTIEINFDWMKLGAEFVGKMVVRPVTTHGCIS